MAAELEGLACRLACGRMTARSKSSIAQGLEQCVAAADANNEPAYAEANLAFHAAIHAAAGNDRLANQLSELETLINPYRSMPYEMHNRLQQSVIEHREIYDALIDGHAAAAQDLMRDHMMLQGKRLPLLLQQLGS